MSLKKRSRRSRVTLRKNDRIIHLYEQAVKRLRGQSFHHMAFDEIQYMTKYGGVFVPIQQKTKGEKSKQGAKTRKTGRYVS